MKDITVCDGSPTTTTAAAAAAAICQVLYCAYSHAEPGDYHQLNISFSLSLSLSSFVLLTS